MTTPGETTADDVVRLFANGAAGLSAYEEWLLRNVDVTETVTRHVTRAAYQLSPDDVRSVARRTEHALGRVRRVDAECVAEVRDWTTPFATAHILHIALEEMGSLFTWQEFRRYCQESPTGRTGLWEPAKQAVARARSAGHSPEAAFNAMRYRIGNSYYSFLRELYVLSQLRELGVDVQYHPMADVLFRVDMWSGNTIVNLYIGNRRFRQGEQGRKLQSHRLLADAPTTFRHLDMELVARTDFGSVWLPDDAEIARHAFCLLKATGGGPSVAPPSVWSTRLGEAGRGHDGQGTEPQA